MSYPDSARTIVGHAQDEARRMRAQLIEPEHLLLGLIRDGSSIGGRVLSDFGVSIGPARDVVEARLAAASGSSQDEELRLAPASESVLQSALRLGLGETEADLLVVLLRRGQGPASEVLVALGADPDAVRAEAKRRAWPSAPPGVSRYVHVTARPIADGADDDEQERPV